MHKQLKIVLHAANLQLIVLFASALIFPNVHSMPHPLLNPGLIENVGVTQAQTAKNSGLIEASPPIGAAINALNSFTKTTDNVAAPEAISGRTGLTEETSGVLSRVASTVDNALKVVNQVTGSTGSLGGVTDTIGDVTGTVSGVTGTVGGVTGAVGDVTGTVGGVTGAVGGVLSDVPGSDNLLTQLGVLDNLGNIQLQNGSESLILKLISINPRLAVAANLLNQIYSVQGVTGTSALSGISGATGGDILGGLTNNLGAIQQQNPGSIISGGNISGLRAVTVNPQLSIVANLLNVLNQIKDPSSAPNCVCDGKIAGLENGSNNFGTIQTQNGDPGSSLIDVNPQIGATANVANALTEQESLPSTRGASNGQTNNFGTIQQQNAATNSKDLRFVTINPQLSIAANLLNILNQISGQPVSGATGSGLNNFGTIQTQNGAENTEPSLLNVSPAIASAVNLANSANQGPSGILSPVGGILSGGTQQPIAADGNPTLRLITMNPQLALVANLLNLLSQAQSGPSNCICNGNRSIPAASSGITNNFGVLQTQNQNINGDESNGLIGVNPQSAGVVNALNTVNEISGSAAEGSVCVGDNFGVVQTQNGNDNAVLDISPQIGVGVNALNTVSQRVRCRPTTTPLTSSTPVTGQPTAAPLTIAPTTVVPPTIAPPTVVPPTIAPPTIAPPTIAPPTITPPTITPPIVVPPTAPPRVCYRRVCQRYRNSPTHPYCHNCPEQLPPYEAIQVDANTIY